MSEVKRRWRDYKTASGQRPVKKFLMALDEDERAAIADAMALVREKGEREGGARKLRNRIWEVRVDQGGVIHRITFASVGQRGRVLLFPIERFAEDCERAIFAAVER